MTEKKPKHAIRTSVTAYRFASMRANETIQKKNGRQRTPSKLPTSVDELRAKLADEFDDLVYRSVQPGANGDAFARAFEGKKKR